MSRTTKRDRRNIALASREVNRNGLTFARWLYAAGIDHKQADKYWSDWHKGVDPSEYRNGNPITMNQGLMVGGIALAGVVIGYFAFKKKPEVKVISLSDGLTMVVQWMRRTAARCPQLPADAIPKDAEIPQVVEKLRSSGYTSMDQAKIEACLAKFDGASCEVIATLTERDIICDTALLK